ncbi:MAG: hypothetical protein Q8P18_10270 [Pseudomonadota bacterium]|nr:hypothetical protein [Pseudomonadota bacterium]
MLLIASGLMTGCTGSSGAAYTLNLTPVVAALQTPFDGLDRIDLVLTPADGTPLRVPMDAPTSGASSAVSGLPALTDTRISVEGFEDGELILRGMTEPLTASDGVVDADVFIASTEKTAWLGSLASGLYLPMLVALGEGRFWLAGGLTNDLNDAPVKGQKAMYILTLAPPGEGLAFTSVGDLPEYETNDGAVETARIGAGFTPLTVSGPDQGKVLVTGGAPRDPLGGGGEASRGVSLYDPTADTWEDIPALASLQEPRAQHLASENRLGNVVIWGGYGAQSGRGSVLLNNTVEYYDSASRTFSEVGVSTIGPLDAMMADLGEDGTLLCGGADLGDGTWASSATCDRVKLDGSGIESFPDLPAGLAGAAMVALADGSILATGGASVSYDAPVSTSATVSASASAWLYNPSTERWGDLSASMVVGRAGHKMVLLADGRVLIAGGAKSFNSNEPTTDSVSCLELYNPVGGTFESVDGCQDGEDAGGLSGGAYSPQVVYDPDYGALIVGGVAADGSAHSGVALFVPEL